MPLLDLSSIEAPEIAMFVAQDDQTCPHATAEKTKDSIGDAVKQFYTIDFQGHEYFAGANDYDFMVNLMNELVVPTTASSVLNISIAFTSLVLSTSMLA